MHNHILRTLVQTATPATAVTGKAAFRTLCARFAAIAGATLTAIPSAAMEHAAHLPPRTRLRLRLWLLFTATRERNTAFVTRARFEDLVPAAAHTALAALSLSLVDHAARINILDAFPRFNATEE